METKGREEIALDIPPLSALVRKTLALAKRKPDAPEAASGSSQFSDLRRRLRAVRVKRPLQLLRDRRRRRGLDRRPLH